MAGQKKTHSRGMQPSLFAAGEKAAQSEESAPVKEKATPPLAPQAVKIRNTYDANKTQRNIQPPLLGAPVVFHGDDKKIKDGEMYRGVERGKDGKPVRTENDEYIYREIYSPTHGIALDVGMIDYDPARHKNTLKYVVVGVTANDAEFRAFVDNYQGEYGPADTCEFIAGEDFFLSIGQAKREKYFRKNNKPVRLLIPGAKIHISDGYAQDSRDRGYDDAVDIGLTPLYDLPGTEQEFKYIVSKKEDFGRYTGHRGELVIQTEFDELVSYAIWMYI